MHLPLRILLQILLQTKGCVVSLLLLVDVLLRISPFQGSIESDLINLSIGVQYSLF